MPGRITIVEQLGHGCTYNSSCAISGATIITPPGIDSFQLNDNNLMDYDQYNEFPSSSKVGQDLITGNKEFIRIEERTLALQEPHQVLIFIVQEWTM